MARDYYATLGVDQKATDQELKRAYRKLARELHPDVNPDEAAQARFRDISTAYEVLSDPEKRRIVDLGGDPSPRVAAEAVPASAAVSVAASATCSKRSSAAEAVQAADRAAASSRAPIPSCAPG